jgi:uncharacterized DUF497 family protein
LRPTNTKNSNVSSSAAAALRRQNCRTRGSFETATKVFKDPFAIERLDDREDYDEDRYILTGTAEGVVLVVVYIERNGQIRIISARRATKHEQDDYFIENN